MRKFGIRIGRFGFMTTRSGELKCYDYTDLRPILGTWEFPTRIERRQFQAARDKAITELQAAIDQQNAAMGAKTE